MSELLTRFKAKIPRRDPALGLHVCKFRCLERSYTYLHTHPEFEIAVCPFDRGFYKIQDREYRIEPGDVFIVNSNDLHQPILDREDNQGAVVAYLSADLTGDETGGSWSVPFMLASFLEQNRLRGLPKVLELMQELHAAYRSEQPHWQQVCRAILVHILALISQRHIQDSDKRRNGRQLEQIHRFAQVIQHVNAHLSEDLPVTRLYRISGLSRSRFCERFKAAFGASVTTYIQDQRINRARRLLRSSDLSITEVCHASGFNWVGFFNTTFKRRTGLSPTAYRKQFHEGAGEK